MNVVWVVHVAPQGHPEDRVLEGVFATKGAATGWVDDERELRGSTGVYDVARWTVKGRWTGRAPAPQPIYFCPVCGAAAKPDSDDVGDFWICENGHTFDQPNARPPSEDA